MKNFRGLKIFRLRLTKYSRCPGVPGNVVAPGVLIVLHYSSVYISSLTSTLLMKTITTNPMLSCLQNAC